MFFVKALSNERQHIFLVASMLWLPVHGLACECSIGPTCSDWIFTLTPGSDIEGLLRSAQSSVGKSECVLRRGWQTRLQGAACSVRLSQQQSSMAWRWVWGNVKAVLAVWMWPRGHCPNPVRTARPFEALLLDRTLFRSLILLICSKRWLSKMTWQDFHFTVKPNLTRHHYRHLKGNCCFVTMCARQAVTQQTSADNTSYVCTHE